MDIRARLSLLLICFLGTGVMVLFRLFYWQVLSFEKLAAAAQSQHFVSFEVPAQRGRILASDGFPLATNQEAYLLSASLPDLKESPQSLASQLAPLIASPSAVLETELILKERLTKEGLVWVPLKHKLEKEVKDEIEGLKLEGIKLEPESLRGYPEASAAAHLLGFVGSDSTGLSKGYFGLEGFYDWQLKGHSGEVRQERDAAGRPILIGGFGEEVSQNGRDLVLYLDRAVQFAVEKSLKEGIEKMGAKAGSAIVMDPKTGGILGMASFPAYDPKNFSEYETGLYKNPVVADLFEPGSILKPLVMSAALDDKAVTLKTRCDRCDGPRRISGYTVSTFNDQYYPDSSMVEILEHSDNVGMVFVGGKLGAKKLHDYYHQFGIEEKTGIDLEEETSSELRAVKDWKEIDLATASFGQGVALTRIQVVAAFGALANGGKLMQPLVVKKIVTSEKEVEIEPKEVRQVIKPEVASMITEMLVSTTEKSPLKFPRDRVEGLGNYRIAAKSGTAEIPVGGEYDPEKTIASVVGYAPASDPKFVILVSLVEPSARPWGSDTAGPIFFEILNELFLYYGIQP